MARVLEGKVGKSYKHFAELFDSLPMAAKEIYFYALENLPEDKDFVETFIIANPILGVDECKSPIEKIFYVAFEIVCLFRRDELPDFVDCMYSYPQLEIETNAHRYIADFSIGAENEEGIYTILLVECDGHEFHQKTKKQVEHDNTRQYELKMVGYDILRFSGSQIYNDPFKCANDVFDYALLKLNGGKNGSL